MPYAFTTENLHLSINRQFSLLYAMENLQSVVVSETFLHFTLKSTDKKLSNVF